MSDYAGQYLPIPAPEIRRRIGDQGIGDYRFSRLHGFYHGLDEKRSSPASPTKNRQISKEVCRFYFFALNYSLITKFSVDFWEVISYNE